MIKVAYWGLSLGLRGCDVLQLIWASEEEPPYFVANSSLSLDAPMSVLTVPKAVLCGNIVVLPYDFQRLVVWDWTVDASAILRISNISAYGVRAAGSHSTKDLTSPPIDA